MTNTSTPLQTALNTMWFQMELMEQTELMDPMEQTEHRDLEDDVNTSLGANVFSESTNNDRKRSAEFAATMEACAKTREYADNQAAEIRTRDRLYTMQDRRRAFIKEIGGKDALKMLRESESQDSCCSDIDEMEKQIEILKKRLAKLAGSTSE
jgi:hypothetical protein